MVCIVLIGISLDQTIVESKYGYEFPKEVIDATVARLTNQIWKLIPMRENSEDWQKQLRNVTIEISGLDKIFLSNPLFLPLLATLEGINNPDVSFEDYRTKVFSAISILQRLKK